MTRGTIVWTKIDEAPALATYSFLPIVQAFTKTAGVHVETADISLAGRILAQFPERLGPEQQVPDPVLREGNSDRRAPVSVKNFAKKHPHRLGEWTPANHARVVSMSDGDFYGNEKSVVVSRGDTLRIELVNSAGTTVLKDAVPVLDGEIVSTTFMSAAALKAFYAAQIAKAKDDGLLLSLHLKATMMKVSDPVMFGYAVQTFYSDVFDLSLIHI